MEAGPRFAGAHLPSLGSGPPPSWREPYAINAGIPQNRNPTPLILIRMLPSIRNAQPTSHRNTAQNSPQKSACLNRLLI